MCPRNHTPYSSTPALYVNYLLTFKCAVFMLFTETDYTRNTFNFETLGGSTECMLESGFSSICSRSETEGL